MKNTFILISLLFAGMVACSKETPNGFIKFYKQYHDEHGIISFKISAGLANFFVDNEDKEVKAFLKKADKVVFLIADQSRQAMRDSMNICMSADKYPTIMEVKDGQATIRFTARNEKNGISEIIMTVIDQERLVIMAIKGDFTTEDAKKIAKAIDVNKVVKN
jgi:hypothetical protein